MEENNFFDIIKAMGEDDNQGLMMATTLVDVRDHPQGAIVGFGVLKKYGDDAKLQVIGFPGKYMCFAFFIDRII